MYINISKISSPSCHYFLCLCIYEFEDNPFPTPYTYVCIIKLPTHIKTLENIYFLFFSFYFHY